MQNQNDEFLRQLQLEALGIASTTPELRDGVIISHLNREVEEMLNPSNHSNSDETLDTDYEEYDDELQDLEDYSNDEADNEETLLDQLLREADELQRITSSNPTSIANTESPSIPDIEDLEQEIGNNEYWDGYGVRWVSDRVLVNNSIFLCTDGTYVESGYEVRINGRIYNGLKYVFSSDEDGNPYCDDISETYRDLILFEEDSYTSERFSIASISNLPLTYLEQENAYVDISEIPSSFYINNGKLERVEIYEGDIKAQFLEKYPFAEATLNSLYKENWDIARETKFFRKPMITIKFDQLVISNSLGETHLIRELYIGLLLDSSLKLVSALVGGRGLMSIEEASSGYVHSHLNIPYNSMGFFCLGSGPLPLYIKMFNDNPSENSFFSVLFNAKIVAEWESIEGTPHKRMSNIGQSQINPDSDISIPENLLNELYNKIILEDVLPINLTTVDGKKSFKVDNNKLEEILAHHISKIMSSLDLTRYPLLIVGKDDSTQNYIRRMRGDVNEKVSETPLLEFKGVKIFPTVKKLNNDTQQEIKKVSHPFLTRRLRERIETRILDYYFEEN